MSKLEELIQQLCPDGVEYKELGKLSTIETGKQLNKTAMFAVGDFPVLNGGINPSGYYNLHNTEANTIAISQGGASAGYVNFMETKFWAGAHCFVVKPTNSTIDNKFLFYILKNDQEKLMNAKLGAGIPGLSKKELTTYQLPVPPLPIQQEIVNILDKFTQLQAELQAELEARCKQYEYYRNELLNFEGKDVGWKKLGEICKIGDGLHGTPIYTDSGRYYFINGNNLGGGKIKFDSNTKKVDDSTYKKYGIPFSSENTVFMSINGTIGSVCLFNNENVVLGKSVAYFNVISKCLYSKFLFYILQTKYAKEFFEQQKTGSTIKNLGLKALREFRIPIPLIEEQNRIVAILDKFDALANDPSVGLPAEIEARRKQYEYYRGNLLDFKRKEA